MLSVLVRLTALKTTRHNIVPADAALKIPASVIAPVTSLASKLHTKLMVLSVTVVLSSASRDQANVSRSVSPAAAAVVPVPRPMCDITVGVAFMRDAM